MNYSHRNSKRFAVCGICLIKTSFRNSNLRWRQPVESCSLLNSDTRAMRYVILLTFASAVQQVGVPKGYELVYTRILVFI